MTETDRAYHEWAATLPDEEGLAAIDFLYHDFLPPDTNCRLCGIEHAAINPDSVLAAPRSVEEPESRSIMRRKNIMAGRDMDEGIPERPPFAPRSVERTEPRPCYWCGEPFPCPTYRSIGAHARQDFPWRQR